MSTPTLTISSKNYASWSLRGWLLMKLARVEFEEIFIPPGDPDVRAEILLLSSSVLVPCLEYDGIKIWDTLAIAEFLNEVHPNAGLLPDERAARAHCRAICGEMHAGFGALRAALPMNIKGFFPNFAVWSRAQADIDRILVIWRDCFVKYGGPYLFGAAPCAADAMYAPVVTRFLSYDVKMDADCSAYCQRIMTMPEIQDWISAAKLEPDDFDELDMEF
jgi:glutathione S-transferase